MTHEQTMKILIPALTLLPFALLAVILPRYGSARRGLLFGVTLPLEFVETPPAQAAMRRFQQRMQWTTCLVLVGVALGAASDRALLLTLGTVGGIAVDLAAMMLFYQRERSLLLPYAIKVPIVRSAELDAQRPWAPMAWTLAALLPIAAELLWLRGHWQSFPERWPRHWNAHGIANGWGTRSPGSVCGPLLAGLPVIVIFILLMAFMSFAPGTQASQRRRFLVPMAATTWAMALLFCTLALTPLAPALGEAGTVGILIGFLVLILSLILWGLQRSGLFQTNKDLRSEPPYDGTPDAGWIGGGLIYYNPADMAVLVPKRMGFGWTLNFARPLAWLYLGTVVGLALLSAIVPHALGGHWRR